MFDVTSASLLASAINQSRGVCYLITFLAPKHDSLDSRVQILKWEPLNPLTLFPTQLILLTACCSALSSQNILPDNTIIGASIDGRACLGGIPLVCLNETLELHLVRLNWGREGRSSDFKSFDHWIRILSSTSVLHIYITPEPRAPLPHAPPCSLTALSLLPHAFQCSRTYASPWGGRARLAKSKCHSPIIRPWLHASRYITTITRNLSLWSRVQSFSASLTYPSWHVQLVLCICAVRSSCSKSWKRWWLRQRLQSTYEQKRIINTYHTLILFWPVAYQFMDVTVGFGALGKNWKIQATSRKDMATMLMTLPAFPSLNRDGGKGSPRIRFWRIPAHCLG